MCTLAWGLSSEALWLCFNRDEKRDRPEAQAPLIDRSGLVPIVYARDPQGGGTWLSASAAGFCVAIMNKYDVSNSQAQGGLTSRGGIVLDLVHSGDPVEAGNRLAWMDLKGRFAPFFLFILSPESASFLTWNGVNLERSSGCPRFWTTSSYQQERVCSHRQNIWQTAIQKEPVSLPKAVGILRQRASRPAYGMTMDRPDARTVSQTVIELNSRHLTYQYARRMRDEYSFEEPEVIAW